MRRTAYSWRSRAPSKISGTECGIFPLATVAPFAGGVAVLSQAFFTGFIFSARPAQLKAIILSSFSLPSLGTDTPFAARPYHSAMLAMIHVSGRRAGGCLAAPDTNR